MATHVLLADEQLGPIDDAVVLWFPAPASATGEDTAEFHIHGGRAVLAALFGALASIEGLRPAEPGEFTRRAFENGKLDLTEAEGLDDLIHADTDRQRKQALRQLKGLLGDRARNWRQQIIEALALVEVGIDFSDEGDVSAELMAPALEKAEALRREIAQVLSAQGRSERLRDGLVVAIAGQPNVGKSTLMNQLARRDVAIVSPHAGTTRDVIEVQLDLDGYPVTVIDTAGIRETLDPVEEEGVRRARVRASEADLVLWLVDSTDAARPEGWLTASDAPVWIISTKTDVSAAGSDDARLTISAERGDGMSELMSALVEFASNYFGQGEAGFITRDRQRDLLRRTADLLQHAATSAQRGDELVAEDFRAAAHQLGRLLGRVDVEDVLDSIFRDFCIGK
jgi:tRNA modification GTPase